MNRKTFALQRGKTNLNNNSSSSSNNNSSNNSKINIHNEINQKRRRIKRAGIADDACLENVSMQTIFDLNFREIIWWS